MGGGVCVDSRDCTQEGRWMGDITHDAKGPVTTQGTLLLSKYLQQGRCPRMLAEGPWRPALRSHTACLLLSVWAMLESSGRMCTADEQGHQDGLPVWGVLACWPRLDLSSVVGSADAFTSQLGGVGTTWPHFTDGRTDALRGKRPAQGPVIRGALTASPSICALNCDV